LIQKEIKMSDRPNLVNNKDRGFLQELMGQAKLILRLIADRRVSLLLKLLPIAAAIYVVSPIDLLPGLALPVIGALDDAAVIWLGTTLFVSLCPPDVVREYTEELDGTLAGDWRDAPGEAVSGEIVPVEPKNESPE
jgi:uncharacterized membrane protein YkvA (DUF1232 family)